MADKLKDILSQLNQEIEQEKLLQYLNKELGTTEQHAVESQMIDDPFVNDAMEGLQEMKNPKDIPAYVEQLNNNLRQQLDKKKKRKEKRKIPQQTWTYITIVVLLLLCIIAYVVIKKLSP